MDWLSEIENFKVPPSRIPVNKSFAETFAEELVDAYISDLSKARYLNANDPNWQTNWAFNLNR